MDVFTLSLVSLSFLLGFPFRPSREKLGHFGRILLWGPTLVGFFWGHFRVVSRDFPGRGGNSGV